MTVLPLAREARDIVRTTCAYCGVGCGVLASSDGQGGATVAGDPAHPANFGRLCSKGSALGETLGLEGRLLAPVIGGRPAGWDEALDHVANRFAAIAAAHGPDAIAFYVSGQLLTEDYYVANKLLKGFIGSRHLDTNSRLCMASSVAGHRRAFGSDTVPGTYEDLELADLVVLVGSNLAWCHPVLFQRIAAAREARPDMRVVVVDPRRTATCDIADLHLPLAAGSDVALFNGLLLHLHDTGVVDRRFVDRHTVGLDAALAAARAATPDVAAVARWCGLPAADVARLYAWVAQSERTVTVYSQGVNQSSAGTDKVNAIINTHLLTGRIGRPGMGPFSVTGQPNAMGGREVGALANQLAAHMDYDDPVAIDRVRRFWQAPHLATGAGHKAIDLFRAIGTGEIKAVWVMATNPAVSMPDAGQVVRALQACDFVVVSDFVRDTDTARLAHVLLPAAAWGEKDGTVTNSERRISRQRPLRPAPGLARPDWWALSQIGRRLGYAEAFDYHGPADIFREHARLSAFENDGARAFDIGAVADIPASLYDGLEPFQWPWRAGESGLQQRLFGDGSFHTPDRRGRFVAVTPRPPCHAATEAFPLVLNTGRYRDQWHTMTRTGRTPRLSAHRPVPLLAVHPDDAARFGLADDGLAHIESRWGAAVMRVQTTAEQRPGTVFAPMHWTGVLSAAGRVNEVVNPQADPISGQPELKATPVRVSAVATRWQGFVLSRQPLAFDCRGYWVAVRGAGHWRYELAGPEAPVAAWERLEALATAAVTEAEWLLYRDPAIGRYRAALLHGGQLQLAMYIAPDAAGLPSRIGPAALFSEARITPGQRRSVLAGRDPGRSADLGPAVCACHGVGRDAIEKAIATGCRTTRALGERLRAGTNCGSCLPELRALLAGVA
ncbi:nitrate reductase [Vineibacter terrae]|uniref:Nitrate reductase n=1 Tax=Vineibacter terrae TaxID=2586908 RepID=A0A5C8PCH9_9HYPH|nr:nitrate reductase [Vineibacter terrae]TXL71508.1 nitrate reductase [Vineibacter terrae]